ncbi:type II toxin-antitoxin system HigB family toxin [uncultured Chitinophaga sp.]|uniref:type II toxin-antitoxin system HigB family toxin n=1 Tax=Chitinophaga sp. TaxID=1869181 RepID=UPI00345AB650
MHIISRGPIDDFGKKHPPAAIPLNEWWQRMKKAKPQNLNELKEIFGACDLIENDRCVFNIGGNNYRLVAIIRYKIQRVFVRAVLTHSEYDRHNDRGTLSSL